MLRHSAAPLAISVFLLTACGPDDEATITPEPMVPTGEQPPGGVTPTDPTPSEPPPSGSDQSTPEFTLVITSPSDGQTLTLTSSSKPRSLSTLPENQPWTLLVKSPDGRGGFLRLRFQDNGNGDAEHFTYDEESGELTLVAPVDFERPVDANEDSSFELQMVAIDYPGFPAMDFALDVIDEKEIFETYPVVWLYGESQFGGLGRNITPLGDMNGDGRPELAVAAPGRHQRDRYTTLPPSGYHPAGEIYLVSGEVLGNETLLNFTDESGPGILHVTGSEETLNLGYSMTSIQDLDGDEVDDIVIARDDRDIHVVSGAALWQHIRKGGTLSFEELTSGVISLEDTNFTHKLDPRTFAPLGDLDGDGLSELAFCTNQVKFGNDVDANVFTLSGAALKDVMLGETTRPVTDFFETSQAAYYSYLGNHGTCGPLTAIGDVDGDAMMDIAIPMPGPGAGDSGTLVFDGSELLNMMQQGGRFRVSTFDRIFGGIKEPFVHFTDSAATGTEQHFMVNALGDVTGDGLDDFSFSWGRYQRANDSAYIVKGDPDLLSDLGETRDLRSMISSGGTIQLAASPTNLGVDQARVEHVHALPASEDGSQEALIFVGAGESSGLTFESYILSADDLPDGGTSIVPLPIVGGGKLAIPRANSRQLSYVKPVGDLNTDGYTDLAIGWGTNSNYGADTGAVMLISGQEISAAHERGETLWPHTMFYTPE